MKRNNKKGFTIVELVIVIAVIAILSAVLIPTFGGIVDKANNSARDQEAKNALTEYIANASATELGAGIDGYIKIDEYYYVVADGNIDLENEGTTAPASTLKHLNHVDAGTKDHKCDVCEAAMGEHKANTENDNKCDYCGEVVTP